MKKYKPGKIPGFLSNLKNEIFYKGFLQLQPEQEPHDGQQLPEEDFPLGHSHFQLIKNNTTLQTPERPMM